MLLQRVEHVLRSMLVKGVHKIKRAGGRTEEFGWWFGGGGGAQHLSRGTGSVKYKAWWQIIHSMTRL